MLRSIHSFRFSSAPRDSPPINLAGGQLLYLTYKEARSRSMTQLEIAYRYGTTPQEAEMRALDSVREVYGIRRIRFDPKERIVRVEFDASVSKSRQ